MPASDAALARITGATRLCHWLQTLHGRRRPVLRGGLRGFVSADLESLALAEVLPSFTNVMGDETPPQIVRFGEGYTPGPADQADA
jgi:hypothetical protein